MKRAFLGIFLLASVSCGDMVRQGTASSFLIVQSLEGASGGDPGDFTGTVRSDVLTENSIFNDLGRVTFQLGLKDPGPPASPTTPSPNNFITVDRYHVEFVRSVRRRLADDSGLHAGQTPGQGGSAARRAAAVAADHLDDCESDVLRARSDGQGSVRGRADRRQLRRLRRSGLKSCTRRDTRVQL